MEERLLQFRPVNNAKNRTFVCEICAKPFKKVKQGKGKYFVPACKCEKIRLKKPKS